MILIWRVQTGDGHLWILDNFKGAVNLSVSVVEGKVNWVFLSSEVQILVPERREIFSGEFE